MKPIDKKFFENLPRELQIEIAENQHRKDFNESELARMQLRLADALSSLKEPGRRTDLDEAEDTSSKNLEQVDHGVLGEVSKRSGESHETTRKRLMLYKEAQNDPYCAGLMEKVDRREASISKAFNKLQRYQTRKRMMAEAEAATPLPENMSLVCGSFEESKLLDESVDLILSDPPYEKKSLAVYEGVARFAMRVLKPGGSCVVYCGHHMLLEIGRVMQEQGLKYWHQLILLHNGRKPSLYGRQVFVNYKPLLWFVKGDRPNCKEFLNDVISNSKEPDKLLHKWQQDTAESCYIIEHLTYQGQLVVDPCCGSGTTLVAANMLERRAFGYEIDRDAAEIAKGRIAQWLGNAKRDNLQAQKK